VKQFCLILFSFFLGIESGWSYDYAGAQAKANQKCAHSLYFPLAKYQAPSCGFKGYTFRNGAWHGGNDYTVPSGTPVYAAASGMAVKTIKNMCYSSDEPNYGSEVEIRHPNGLLTIYAHLDCDSIKVKTGQFVKVGQLIAKSDNTGWSTGPHLHFEVRIDSTSYSRGTPVDPYPALWVCKPPVTSAVDGAMAIAVKRALSHAAQTIRQSQNQWLFSVQKITQGFSNFFPGQAKVVACNIPNKATNVDCLLDIKFVFSQSIPIRDFANAFFIEPMDKVMILFPPDYHYIQGDTRQMEIAGGWVMEPHTRYTITLNKDIPGRPHYDIVPWQVTFTTGDWPVP